MALAAPRTHIDALPYIDTHYDQADKELVKRLIQEQLKISKTNPDDYHKHKPYQPNFQNNPILQTEWERVQNGTPMHKMDTKNYGVLPPDQDQQNHVNAWKQAVHNAQAQFQHQSTRIENLQLLAESGSDIWLRYLEELDVTSKRLLERHTSLSLDVDEINRKRKHAQDQVAPRLARMETDWLHLIRKNYELERECDRLENVCSSFEGVDRERR